MKRSLTLLVFGVLGGLPTIAAAAPDPTDPYSAEALRRAEIDAYTQAAAAETNPTTKAAYLAKARQLAEQADLSSERRAGAARQVDEVTRRMEREDKLADARAKQMEDMYDRPGFFDKVGNKMVDVLGNAIAAMLQKWIAGGGKDKDLEDQIRRLQEERDRLMNGRDDPTIGSDTGEPGMGRIITDANGNYGYDRDGDGVVDIPLNSDGSLGSFNPTNDDGYASPGSTNGLGGGGGTNPFDSPSTAGGLTNGLGSVGGGGGISPGGAFNGGGFTPNNGAGTNPGGVANADGADDKDKDGEDGGPLGGAGGAGAAGGVNGASANLGTSKDVNGDGKIDENEAALETVMGRPLILPKLEFEDLAGDKKAASKGWKDEWEDDGWDDARDNGDKKKKKKSGDNKDGSDDWSDDDDWGDEWDESKKAGKKKKTDAKSDTTSAEEKQAAELVDQIIRVETQLAEWRKQEKKAKAEGKDVYGYTEAGAEKKDPLKDVRDSSGKIDLTKVDIWLIERETWRDGKEPVRYKLKVSEDVKDLDPIHGGVIVVRGKVEALNVDKRVLDEIKGKVKEIEVAQVILSAEKPPENSDLDESDDVGGLDEDDGHGHDKKDAKKGDDWGSDDEGW